MYRPEPRSPNAAAVLRTLRAQANPANVAGMARYGINAKNTLGVSIPFLRALAKTLGRDHALALELWATGVHEARILAGLVAEPARLTGAQMEAWVREFDSWDVCDQVCSNCFDKAALAYEKAAVWTRRPEEYVKRAGFVLMACLSVHDKEAQDQVFLDFFPMIEHESRDERNFVKKAVNWALRQIGKRNPDLRGPALDLARKLSASEDRTARWIGKDAARELSRPVSKRS
jgi:3-methyladenine DNA glycosylase AlkD